MSKKLALKNVKGLQIIKLTPEALQFITQSISNKSLSDIFKFQHAMSVRAVVEIGDVIKIPSDANDTFNNNTDTSALKKFLYNYFTNYGSFNQIEIRHYNKNNKLAPHIDSVNKTNDDTVVMINVSGSATLTFSLGDQSYNINVSKGDVVIINDDARFNWYHSLLVKTNNRISIIMRNLVV